MATQANSQEAILIGGHPLSGILQGAKYQITGVPGWWERPGVKRDAIQRERSDGDFPMPWNFDARYITVQGFVTARDHRQMHHIMDQLNGLCVSQREWLTVQGHGPTSSVLVEADAQPVLTVENDHMLRFALYFKAADPLRTGALYTTPIGDVQTQHSQLGNYPAWPVIRVWPVNAPGGYGINANYGGRTRRWEFTSNAWSSQAHLIDLRSGRHFVNDEEQPARLGRAQTWNIPPRTNVLVRLYPLNEAHSLTGELEYRDTYI